MSYDAMMAEGLVRNMPRKPIEIAPKADTTVEIDQDRGDGDTSHNNPLNPLTSGATDHIDTDRYKMVERAIMSRTGAKPTYATVLRIMGQIDAKSYNRRMKARRHTTRTPAGVPVKTTIADQIPAGRASGSFGRTSERTTIGGYKGPRFGVIVTVAGVSPEMPTQRSIARNVPSKRNFGGIT